MKMSCEMMLSIIDWDHIYNDYSYALIHLFKNKKYRDHYLKVLASGRELYVDNSAFELNGISYDPLLFIKEIKKLYDEAVKKTKNPDNLNLTIVLPDIISDYKATIYKTLYTLGYIKEHLNEYFSKWKYMLVIQGKTLEEMLICYDVYRNLESNLQLTKVIYGIPSRCVDYLQRFKDNSKEIAYCEGRKFFITELISKKIVREKSLHLLGCSLPQEFLYYSKIKPELSKYIYSIDTSNPIVHGYKRIKYTDEGLNFKDPLLLADIINCKVDEEQKEIIKHNLKYFKYFVKGGNL